MARFVVRGSYVVGSDGADFFDAAEWLSPTQLVGGNGNDEYRIQPTDHLVIETADGGTDLVRLASAAFPYTLPEFVENLLLESGSGELYGNGLANRITGGASNDMLAGRGGNDTLVGGASSDLYLVEDPLDVVVELEDGGDEDTIQASVSYTLPSHVENLLLTGSFTVGNGNALANAITVTADGPVTVNGGAGDDTLMANGEAGDDSLSGDAGNDVLDGGGGSDTLAGGAGDDEYRVVAVNGRILDRIVEAPGAGIDLLVTNAALIEMAPNVEHVRLELMGLSSFPDVTVIGNALDNAIVTGTGNDSLTGGLGNDLLDGQGGADTLAGGLGNDIYVVESSADVVVEFAGEGTDTVNAAIAWRLGAHLENLRLLEAAGAAFGEGNALDNRITGNAAGNFLIGLGGNDVLDGGGDADVMVGGAGNDTYYVDDAGDTVIESFSGGTADAVFAATSYRLPSYVESLTLLGTDDFWATGNEGVNRITGNAGGNILDGGGAPGGGLGDTLAGGLGDDVYRVRSANTTIQEAANAGTDAVVTRLSNYVLPINVEALLLEAGGNLSADGNAAANLMRGNAGANTLRGLVGNDSLYGMGGNDSLVGADGNDLLDGGRGNDTLDGGVGNDTFIVDSAGDSVIGGAGIDLVRSSATAFTLGGDVENITLFDAAQNATGNGLGNTMTGNARANQLSGGAGNDLLDGGAGDDTLTGDAGNDTFIVDSAGDVLVDSVTGAAGGIDVVRATASVDLATAEAAGIEQVFLLGDQDLQAFGNDQANTLVGNAGNNTLVGGVGNDTLRGGDGDDVYGIEAATDVVTEFAGEGDDTVVVLSNLAAPYLLPAFVENGQLDDGVVAVLVGNGLDNVLFGNELANRLEGGAGNDVLLASGDTGPGSDSTDTLVGGAGDDTYYVNSRADQVIEGLNAGRDRVFLSDTGNDLNGYVLPANVEDATLVTAEGGGAITGTALDNEVVALLIGAAVGLNGGDGNDVLALDGGFNRTLLTTINTEVLRVTDGAGSIIVNAAALAPAAGGTRLEVTGGDGAVAFTGLNAAIAALAVKESSRDVSLDWSGAATLGVMTVTLRDAGFVADLAIDDDPVVLSLQDAVTTLRLVSEGLENMVSLAGTSPTDIEVSGAAVLSILGLASGRTIGVEDYAGALLSLQLQDGTDATDILTLQVAGSSFALELDDGGGGRALETLDVQVVDGSGQNALTVLTATPDLDLVLSGGAGDGTELELRVGDVSTVDASDFDGRLVLIGVSEPGSTTGLEFVAPTSGAGGFTLWLGEGDDTVYLGFNVGAGNQVRGGRAEGLDDRDTVLMNLSGVLATAGGPWIEEVETIVVFVDDGATGELDGSFLLDAPTGTRLELNGNETTTLRLFDIDLAEVDGETFGGSLEIHLSGGVIPGNPSITNVVGGLGNDQLASAGGHDRLEGRAGADSLSGGAGEDTLFGGVGTDILTGGDGADVFAFQEADLGTGVDVVRDFESGVDQIWLDGALFLADLARLAGTPVLAPEELEETATPSDGALGYLAGTGELWFDPVGLGGPVQLAQFDAGTLLQSSDILVLITA